MAERDALQELEKELQCTICFDTYTDPKLLQCNHVYCRECLQKLLDRNRQEERFLNCPNCRQVTPVPENGMQGLKSAFQTNNFLEIQSSLKRKAGKMSYCPTHVNEELKMYCETCKKLICFKCGIKGAKHRRCHYVELDEVYDEYKEEVIEALEPTKQNISAIKEALQKIGASQEEVSGQYAVVEANIHDTFCQLQANLVYRRNKLVAQLRQFTQRKLGSLSTQHDHVTAMQEKLQHCQVNVEKKLETMSSSEFVEAKASIVDQIENSNSVFQLGVLSPTTTADITFTTSTQATTVCREYGVLSAMEALPDPSKCRTTGSCLDTVMVGGSMKCYFQVVNHWDETCAVQEQLLGCELVSELKDVLYDISFERIKMGYYELNFVPAIKGYHHLHIKISDQHIQGSPFTLLVKSPIEAKNMPKLISAISVHRPWGITINHKRQIIVTEHERHRITMFSPGGVKIGSFGTHGSNNGQFNNPRGVAVDEDDNILVADYKNKRIQKITSNGIFLAATKGMNDLQFKGPKGIAYNTFNKKVYVVDESHFVQIFNSNLVCTGVFGGPGSGEGELSESWGIKCDKFGRVYLPVHYQCRIQVFSDNGHFLKVIGNFGVFSFLLDVAFDNDNNIMYVCDRFLSHVSAFTLEGELLGSFGDGLSYPRGLAVDSGVVYVCDNNNDRISIF